MAGALREPRRFFRMLFLIVLFLGLSHGLHGIALSECDALTKTAEDNLSKGEELSDAGKYREALEHFEQALSTDIYCRPARAHVEIAFIAGIHDLFGEQESALESYKKDLELCLKIFGPDSEDTAVAYNNLGKFYHSMGRYPEALENLQKALAIDVAASGPYSLDAAVPLNNLGGLYQSMGDFSKALDHFQKSLAIRLKFSGPRNPSLANVYNNIGAILEAMGQKDKALENMEKALEIYIATRGMENSGTANAFNNIGSIYIDMGQYEKALDNYGKYKEIVLKIFGPDHPDAARAYNNIATVYFYNGDFVKAIENFEEALSILLKAYGPDYPETATVYNNIGAVYQSMEEYSKALETYKKALPTALQSGDVRLKWNVLAGTSNTLANLGHRASAIFFGKQAVNTIQAMRSSMTIMDKSFRKGFIEMGDKGRVYRRLASLLVDEGRIPEANRVLDLLKEEEYSEYVRGESSEPTENISGTEDEKSLEQSFARISEQITQRGAELAEIKTKAKKGELTEEDRSKEKEILSDLEVASRSFEAFIDDISRQLEKTQGEKAAELTEQELRDIKPLQSTLKALGNGAVVVHYLVADDKLVIILTTPETQVAREAAVSSTALNRMIADARRDLLCPLNDPRPALKKLYEAVFSPISHDLEQARAETLLLSLDGALRYIPFYCLYDGDKYLIERYTAVVFTPASRDKLRIPPTASWKIAGFGVAGKVNEKFTALPSVRYELNGIIRKEGDEEKGILPGTVQIDRDFTLEAMRNALESDFPVIHIASHFVFNPTDKESFLLLGDGSELTLDKIKHQGFRFDDVDLLTLSACETGLGSTEANGREIEGFGTMAQRNGAKGVIATLWSVADRSTGLLMRRMYEIHMKNGVNKAEALRQAQLELLRGEEAKFSRADEIPDERGMRERYCARRSGPPFENPTAPYAHPFFWAPFILMGNYL